MGLLGPDLAVAGLSAVPLLPPLAAAAAATAGMSANFLPLALNNCDLRTPEPTEPEKHAFRFEEEPFYYTK